MPDQKSVKPEANADNHKQQSHPIEVKPEFWDDLFDALPPWFDEVGAIVLLVFGVISFMALLEISSDAYLARAWSETLRSLFGVGSLLISVGIFALGIIILLPKLNIVIELSPQRILGLEVAFLSILGILHLSYGDSELRALAQAGEGGGYIGWGISLPLTWLAGSTVAMTIFAFLLIFSLGIVVGIKRTHISNLLGKWSERLLTYGRGVESKTQKPRSQRSVRVDPTALTGVSRFDRRGNGGTIVRIRPDLENLPPSARQETAPQPPPESIVKDEVDKRLLRTLEKPRDESPTESTGEFSIMGMLVPKTNPKEPQMIERPDGRIKRYFSIDSMKEQKKVGRRAKALPPLDLLQDIEMNPPDDGEINHNVLLIENTLLEFDISIDVVDVKVGPTVTQYAVQPYQDVTNDEGDTIRDRTRLNKIAALSSDLALSLSAKRLRLETPVPGHSYMGVEVPNRTPSTVALRSVYESKNFYEFANKSKSPLVVPLGRDVAGEAIGIDLATMPHLLIAGTTGSGKSVCIAAMATALILNCNPDTVKLVMLDPKMVELSRFNGLPHLLGPVETDIERIIEVLSWCTREMEQRYKLLEENAARNIDTYNSRLGQRRKSEHLPYIVILVDEIGDLMMSKPEETEREVTRIAQMARAVGMHMVIATQRPSVDVITGLIKANFPGRISFAVASGVDSRVILDTNGAENLLGQGDMLYLAPDAGAPKRVQGCYVTDGEVRKVVHHWRKWYRKLKATGKSERFDGPAPWERGLTRREFLSETDPMLEDAIELVIEEQEASASMIQRKLGLGYPRAARIIDLMEELGIIGESVDGGRTRRVLIEKGKDPFQELIDQRTHKKS